jgi:thioredoxin 2
VRKSSNDLLFYNHVERSWKLLPNQLSYLSYYASKYGDIKSDDVKSSTFTWLPDASVKRADAPTSLTNLTLLYFHATWCDQCKIFSPTFSKIETLYQNFSITFTKIDIGSKDSNVQKYKIEQVPTLILTQKNSDNFTEIEPIESLLTEKINEMLLNPVEEEKQVEYKEDHELQRPIENIVELSDSNFASTVDRHDIMVLFYAPWCDLVCKEIIDVFVNVTLEYPTSTLKLGKMDIGSNPVTSQKYKMEEVPSILFFRKHKPPKEVFAEAQEISHIVEKYNKKFTSDPSDPSGVVELNDGDLEQFSKGSKHVMIEFYVKWCSTCLQFAPIYQSIADDIKHNNLTNAIRFAKVNAESNPKLVKWFSAGEFPALFLVTGSKFEGIDLNAVKPELEKRIGINIWTRRSGIWPWISVYSKDPPRQEMNEMTDQNYKDAIQEKSLILFHAVWSTESDDVKSIMSESGGLIKGIKLYFLNIEKYPDVAKYFSVSEVPTVFLYDHGVFQEE